MYYYNDKQFDDILKTFTPGPSFNKSKFREQLERVAWFYDDPEKAGIDYPATEAKKRNLVTVIISTARRTRNKLREADQSIYILEAFRQADDDPAVYRRLRRLQEDLEWLCVLADKAASAIASKIGKGGNRPDASLHEFILSISDLYQLAAENPQAPTGWKADSETGSELLRLLQAALRPLGREMNFSALYQAYLRAREAAEQ